MSIADEIEKLNDLRQAGALSEDEYQEAKEALLAKDHSSGRSFGQAVDDFSRDTNSWGMMIHLSQFCGYLVPLAGLIVPIVLWQMKKDEAEIIDRHGRVVANWIITEFILAIVFGLLCLVFIGIPLFIALAVVAIVFPIIGGVKASNGEVWTYPFSLKFF